MICPHCHRRAPPKAFACPSCGREFGADRKVPRPARRARAAAVAAPTERRPLTVMFCDLVDSVALSQRLDPEDLMAVIERYQTLCDDIVSDRGGFLAKFMGDGVLAYFGYPRADEDDAANAVHAALEIVEAVRELERDVKIKLEARAGIATGLVVLRGRVSRSRQRTVEVVGRILNLAARLQAAAAPSSALISEATRKVTRGHFSYRDLGEIPLRGFPQPVQAWAVEAPNAAISRFQARLIGQPTPFVGRDAEFAVLTKAWTKARKGRGQIVLLFGDAGLGKSRLAREFDLKLGEAVAARVQLQGAPERANSAFRPVALQIERAAGLERRDAPATRLAKLGRWLGWPKTPDPMRMALFASLMEIPWDGPSPIEGLTPEKRRELTMEALLTMAVGWTAHGPLLLVVEDTHWIDASTLELVDRLFERVVDRPVLMLMTSRPGFQPPWRPSDRVVFVELSRLDADSARAVCAHVGAGALPAELEAGVIERAGGIPFYMEELTRAVVEQVAATEDEEAETAEIPISLHESLVARLDRLGSARRIANIGAVIGRQFDYELLAAVAGAPTTQVRSAMGALKRAGLVAQIGTGEAIVYRFRHALLRDAAYESMLRPDRRALHQQVANALEAKFPEICEAEPETLAYHLAQGSTPSSAIPHYVAAGQKAAARGGHREALAHYQAALRLIEKMPEGLERLQAELGCLLPMQVSLAAALGYASDEVQRALTRARDICGRMGDASPLFPVLHALSKFWTVRGDQAEAEALSAACARIAEESGVPLYSAYAASMVGYVMNVTGRPGAQVVEVVRRGLAIYEANEAACAEILSETHVKTALLAVLPIALGRMGDVAAAERAAQESIAWARQLGRPFDLAFTLSFAAGFFLSLGDYRKTLETAREAAEICEARGFAVWLHSAKAHVAMASTHLGDEAAREALLAAMTAWRQMGCNSVSGFYIEHLALIEARRGRHAEALTLADEAIATDERFQDYGFLPGAFATRAQIRLMAPRPDYALAEADLRRAIEYARAQGAPGLEQILMRALEHFKTPSGAVAP